MKNVISRPAYKLNGSIIIPSDKSLSHRAIMFASLANGKSIIKNCSNANDPMSTLRLFKMLGVNIEYVDAQTLSVSSGGVLSKPHHFWIAEIPAPQ